MSQQRSMLMIAAALTAFILVLLAGLATRLSQTATALPTTVADTLATPVASTVVLDPATAALVQEREAAYQAALAEANSRLAQANQQLAQAPIASGAAPAAVSPRGAEQAAVSSFSAEQAAAVAVSYRGGGVVRSVERESEHGMQVYEVKFTDGGKVYVDVASGQVVYARLTEADEAAGDASRDDDDN